MQRLHQHIANVNFGLLLTSLGISKTLIKTSRDGNSQASPLQPPLLLPPSPSRPRPQLIEPDVDHDDDGRGEEAVEEAVDAELLHRGPVGHQEGGQRLEEEEGEEKALAVDVAIEEAV